MRKIAVTGNLASGKSTVCELLRQHGAFIVSTDTLTHELLASDADCIKKLSSHFGKEIVVNHHIDRKKVASLVFSNPQKLYELEQIIHPLIKKRIDVLYNQELQRGTYSMFVVEIPLLFETHWDKDFDITIAVNADTELRRKRFIQKGYTNQDFNLREKRLMPQEEKALRASFTIQNDQDIEQLKVALTPLLPSLDFHD